MEATPIRLSSLLVLALLPTACWDEGEVPQFVCEDPVNSKIPPDECQSDEDCPSGLVCALDLVSEDLTCQLPEDPSPLQLLPDVPTILSAPSTCTPSTSVLLVNQGDETIRIDALQTGKSVLGSDSPRDGEGELIASAELPQELAPADSLAIDLRFVSESPGVYGVVDLEVLTSDGCKRLAVWTVAVGLDSSAITHPLAVDLGTTSPGTLGEPVDIVFTPSGPHADALFAAGGVSNDFVQVDNPIALTTLRSCEPLRTSVRLNAPLEPGVYEGLLVWERLTDGFSGIGFIHLRGRVE